MKARIVGWGGAREGAGRKALPDEKRRKHRVTVFLTDSEHAALTRLAERRGDPPGTIAYELMARGLRLQKDGDESRHGAPGPKRKSR